MKMAILITIFLTGCARPSIEQTKVQYCIGIVHGLQVIRMICSSDKKLLPEIEVNQGTDV